MLIYCATVGTGLLWRFTNNEDLDIYEPVSFFSEPIAPSEKGEHIIVWWGGSEPLRSYMEILYSYELSNITISCESGHETILRLKCRPAGTTFAMIINKNQ